MRTADRIDHVCFYDKPVAKFGRLIETHMATAPRGLRSFLTALPVWLRRKLWTAREIEEALGGGPRVLFTEHHQAHAASAFYPSPFDEAALLTLDGVGEWATTTAGAARGRRRRGESRPVMRSTTSRCSPSCATMVPTRQCSAKKRRRTSASWSRAVVIEAPLGGRAQGGPRRRREGRRSRRGGRTRTQGETRSQRAHECPPGDTNGDRTEGSWEEGSSADDATSGSMHGGGDGGGTLAEGLGVGERGSVTEVRRARSWSR